MKTARIIQDWEKFATDAEICLGGMTLEEWGHFEPLIAEGFNCIINSRNDWDTSFLYRIID